MLAMGAMFGFAAMSIDAGLLFQDRRHLQNAADAAALAGVAELPLNPVAATLKAEEWANNHGIQDDQIRAIEVRTEKFPNDTVYVEVGDEFNWIFARVLGLTTGDVTAEAAARVGSLSGGNNMMPWALLQGESVCLDSNGDAILNQQCTVKVGAGGIVTGWYGALDFDGNGGGAAEYKANIIDGTTNTKYCIAGDPAPGCTSSVSVIDTLSGNKVGPTGSGIDERLALGGAPCDTNSNGKDDFDEVFARNPGGSPTYTTLCGESPRLVIIPIVSYSSVPVHVVTIRGWSLAYLNSYGCVGGGCNGKGHFEVSINIVDAAYSQSVGFMSTYNPDSGFTIRRLIK